MLVKKIVKNISVAISLVVSVSSANAVEKKIDLWTLNYNSMAQNEALAEIASQYEKLNPDVEISITQRAIDELKTALRVSAGSDKGPDIFFSWSGMGLGGEYVKAGMSLPLGDYYQKYDWSNRFLASSLSFADQYGGEKHGVPNTFNGEVIYYNKALFEKAGIENIPTTYDELLSVAEKLHKKKIPAFTFGGSVNWHLMRLMDVLLETKCGALTHDQLNSFNISWSETACVEEAFSELALWTDKYTLKPFMGIDNSQSFSLFEAGRAAMMLEGNWLVGQLEESSGVDGVDIFPFPTGTNRLYGFAEYFYISSKSKFPDTSAEFLDYLNSDEVQQKYRGVFSAVSVNKNINYLNLKPLDAKWIEIFNRYDQMFVNSDQALPTSVTSEYFRLINEVSTGGISPKQASIKMQNFIEKSNL